MNQSMTEPDYLHCSITLSAPLKSLRRDPPRAPKLTYQHVLGDLSIRKQPLAAVHRQSQYGREDDHQKVPPQVKQEWVIPGNEWHALDGQMRLSDGRLGQEKPPELELSYPSSMPPPPTWLLKFVSSAFDTLPTTVDDAGLLRWFRRLRNPIMKASTAQKKPAVQPPPLKNTNADRFMAALPPLPPKERLQQLREQEIQTAQATLDSEPGHRVWLKIIEEAVTTTVVAPLMSPEVLDALYELLATVATDAEQKRIKDEAMQPKDQQDLHPKLGGPGPAAAMKHGNAALHKAPVVVKSFKEVRAAILEEMAAGREPGHSLPEQKKAENAATFAEIRAVIIEETQKKFKLEGQLKEAGNQAKGAKANQNTEANIRPAPVAGIAIADKKTVRPNTLPEVLDTVRVNKAPVLDKPVLDKPVFARVVPSKDKALAGRHKVNDVNDLRDQLDAKEKDLAALHIMLAKTGTEALKAKTLELKELRKVADNRALHRASTREELRAVLEEQAQAAGAREDNDRGRSNVKAALDARKTDKRLIAQAKLEAALISQNEKKYQQAMLEEADSSLGFEDHVRLANQEKAKQSANEWLVVDTGRGLKPLMAGLARARPNARKFIFLRPLSIAHTADARFSNR